MAKGGRDPEPGIAREDGSVRPRCARGQRRRRGARARRYVRPLSRYLSGGARRNRRRAHGADGAHHALAQSGANIVPGSARGGKLRSRSRANASPAPDADYYQFVLDEILAAENKAKQDSETDRRPWRQHAISAVNRTRPVRPRRAGRRQRSHPSPDAFGLHPSAHRRGGHAPRAKGSSGCLRRSSQKKLVFPSVYVATPSAFIETARRSVTSSPPSRVASSLSKSSTELVERVAAF